MKNRIAISVLSLILLSFHATARAEFYKWTDKNGVMHMSTTPPADADGSSGSNVDQVQEDKDRPIDTWQPPAPKAKVYTSEETIQAKRDELNKRIAYSNGECKTRQLPPGATMPHREETCDGLASQYEGMLRSLESDPDRFFYVEDQMKKKNRGEYYDNPPRYPLTYIW